MAKRTKAPAAPEASFSEVIYGGNYRWSEPPSVEAVLGKSLYLATALESLPNMIELWRRTGDGQGDLQALGKAVCEVALFASGILGDLELCGSPLALGWQSGPPLAPIAVLDAPSLGGLSIAAKACLRALGLEFASKESRFGHETGVQEIDPSAIDCEALRNALPLVRDGIARLAYDRTPLMSKSELAHYVCGEATPAAKKVIEYAMKVGTLRVYSRLGDNRSTRYTVSRTQLDALRDSWAAKVSNRAQPSHDPPHDPPTTLTNQDR